MALTVEQVIRELHQTAPKPEVSVDGLIEGEMDWPVTGIATVFSATQEAIQQAIALGLNLIISHEGHYYSHHKTTSPAHDPISQHKASFIRSSGNSLSSSANNSSGDNSSYSSDNSFGDRSSRSFGSSPGVSIYRFHDAIHRMQPDGIMAGLLKELEWDGFVESHQPAASILSMPEIKIEEIARHVKSRLGSPFVRVVGNCTKTCRRVGVLAGYRGGGDLCIPLFHQEELDLIIAGEGPEWETPEYVRDAVFQGHSKTFMLIGHAESEQPGMKLLAETLAARYPDLPVSFLGNAPLFHLL
ncbi:Nif3-like dinuclear metal center hexameric protein [Paenibacillus sp. CAU 1782]